MPGLPGEPKMERHPISASQAFSFAWISFNKRYGLFLVIVSTTFAAWIALEIVVIAGHRFGILLWTVAHLAFVLFFASVEIGFLKICLRLYDGGEPKIADMFAPWPLALKFLAGQVFFVLMVAVGLLLLLVPGVYLAVRYALFGFCMADNGANLMEGFRQSATLTAGTWMNLFTIFAALIMLNILGASLMGLGLFITLPVSALVTTALYRQLGSR